MLTAHPQHRTMKDTCRDIGDISNSEAECALSDLGWGEVGFAIGTFHFFSSCLLGPFIPSIDVSTLGCVPRAISVPW